MPNGTTNNTTAKIFGGVFAAAAIISMMYAMVEPMSQRIDFLERQLAARDSATRAQILTATETIASLAAISERFKEVETQFRAQRDIAIKTEERVNARLNKVEAKEKKISAMEIAIARLQERGKK